MADVANVFLDEVGVDCDGGCGSFACGGDYPCGWGGGFGRGPDGEAARSPAGRGAGETPPVDPAAPGPEQARRSDGAGTDAEHPERLIATLPAVAVRAVQEVPTPALAGTGDVGQLVDGTRREEQPSRSHRTAAGEPEREAAGDLDHAVVDEFDGVA